MRWGVTDEVEDTAQLCLYEIEKCKKESIGPSFAVIYCFKNTLYNTFPLNPYSVQRLY